MHVVGYFHNCNEKLLPYLSLKLLSMKKEQACDFLHRVVDDDTDFKDNLLKVLIVKLYLYFELAE